MISVCPIEVPSWVWSPFIRPEGLVRKRGIVDDVYLSSLTRAEKQGGNLKKRGPDRRPNLRPHHAENQIRNKHGDGTDSPNTETKERKRRAGEEAERRIPRPHPMERRRSEDRAR